MSEKQPKKEGRSLEDYGVIYVSGEIGSSTSESVCKAIIEINMAKTVDCVQLVLNSPGGSILSHRYSWWVMGKHSELIARRKEEDLTHTRIVDHYLRHTRVETAKELHETLLCDVDKWLTAEEAVSFGIADIIEGGALSDAAVQP